MKTPIVLLYVLTLLGCTSAEGNLYLFQEKGNRGYMDAQGQTVLPAVYKQATEFSEGLAAVRVGNEMGYIDRTGKVVIEPGWAMAGAFSQGRAPVMVEGKFGYIDPTGSLVIPAIYSSFTPFKDGFAVVSQEGDSVESEFFGVIDLYGNFVLPPEFKVVNLGDNGLCLAVKEDLGQFYKNGKLINEEAYIFAFPYQEGLALVSREPGDLRYINEEGGTVLDLVRTLVLPQDTQIYMSLGFSQGLAVTGIATTEGDIRYGAVDTAGRWKIQPTYSGLGSFEEGLAPVLIDGLYGFLDKEETIVIPPQFDSVDGFKGELAKAVLDGKPVYINKKGAVIRNAE